MAILTQDSYKYNKFKDLGINYRFSLPSSEPLLQGSIPVLDSSSEDGSTLLGRAKAFSESLARVVNLKEFEAFLGFPLLLESSRQEPPFLTNGATCTEDCISDISYFVRSLMPEAAATEGVGVTTGENVFQGAWAAIKAWARFKSAQKVGDQGGMIEGGTDAARGVTQSLGGASYLIYRGTMVAADAYKVNTAANATTALGQSAYALGMIGNVLFTVFYALIALWGAYGSVKDWQFSAAMKAHEHDDTALFKFLMKKVKADPKEKLKKLKDYFNSLPVEKGQKQLKSYKKELENTALDALAEQFVHLQKPFKAGSDKKPLSKQQARDVLEILFNVNRDKLRYGGDSTYAHYLSSLGLSNEDVEQFDFSALELIGFKLQEMKRQSKKDAKISRVASNSCVDAVKKAASRGLNERLASEDLLVQGSAKKEIANLRDKVVTANTKNKAIHVVLCAIGILGIAASILGFLVLTSPGALALLSITLILCVGMLGTDAYFMYQGWNSGQPGRHDKKYIMIVSLVMIIALVLSTGVTLGFGLSLLPLLCAWILGGVSLNLSVAALFMLSRKEQKWKEDHPDLARLQEVLLEQTQVLDEPLDEKTTALFKKLPKAHRKAVRDKYLKMSRQRQMPFKSEEHKKLDQFYDFSSAYLVQQIQELENMSHAEHELLVRGVKKTVKFFWQKWEAAKIEQNKEWNKKMALRMQALLERVSLKKNQEAEEILLSIQEDALAYEQLKQDVWYVVKKEESKQDLERAVAAVIIDQAPIALQVEGFNEQQEPALVERVADLYSRHSTPLLVA
jgi:hypothetical protein